MGGTTRKELDNLAEAIDSALGCNPRRHSIGGAYGGHALERDGGSSMLTGYLPAGELADWMRAYKSGIYAGRRALIAEVLTAPDGATIAEVRGRFDGYGNPREDAPMPA